HRVDLAANDAYERWRATERDTLGRVLKGNSKPFIAPELPEGVVNLSDPDSRVMRTQGTPPRQAYNAQTAVNDKQIILPAEITVEPVYGQIKYNRHIDRFMRRGRAAAQSEWRLATATHNLLKLHTHWIANTT